MSSIGQAITTVVGAAIGFVVSGFNPMGALYGASIGMTVGGALFPPSIESPQAKVNDVQISGSQYDIPITVLFGKRKMAGNLLWYGNFKIHEHEEGGKGGGGPTYTYNTYSISLCFGLCMGPAVLKKIWAGNDTVSFSTREITTGIYEIYIPLEILSKTFDIVLGRFYTGEHITGDSHLAGFVPRTPIWKNLCYVVLYNRDLGTSTYIKNFTFEVEGQGATDFSPTDVSEAVLTNNLWGLGLNPSYINATINAATKTYCQNNDLLIAPMFTSQVSILDALSYIIQHHDGFITYMDGKIGHQQIKQEDSGGTITEDDMPKEKGDFPIQVSTAGSRDYLNKINVEYTKRDKEYASGCARAIEPVDIRKYGLKDISVRLDAFCAFDRASKMSNLLLYKSLANPERYGFFIGPKFAGLRVGEVYSLTDSHTELSSQKARITTLSEDDNYEVEVIAQEEVDDVYDHFVMGEDTSEPPIPPDLIGPPGDVVNPQAIELIPQYSGDDLVFCVGYSRSVNAAWAGAALYKSYLDTGPYGLVQVKQGSGTTGTVVSVNPLEILLDWDATLESALSLADLVQNAYKNLFIITTATGDKYMKFQNCTLISARRWRLTELIYDLENYPLWDALGDIAVDDKVIFYQQLPHIVTLLNTDVGKTLWIKLPSYNFKGLGQSLADVDYLTKTLAGLYQKPYRPSNVTINGIGLSSTNIKIEHGSPANNIEFAWCSRNRFCTGINIFMGERTDTVPEDTDFVKWQVDVYNGSTLMAVHEITSGTSWTYTYAQQTTDGTAGLTTLIFKWRKVCAVKNSNDLIITVYRV